jgi:hypothetical protein
MRQFKIRVIGKVKVEDTRKLSCWDEDWVDDGKFVYYLPTLKDVATMLYCLVGHGVTWQLSRELCRRTGFDLKQINDSLEKIIEEYALMPDEEAMKNYCKDAKHIE